MDNLRTSANPEPSTTSHQELLQIVSFESEESGISDNELCDVPPEDDHDYQKAINTIMNSSTYSASDTSTNQHRIHLPTPPTRPSHFRCDPAWHWDNASSPINSDCEEKDILEDSEEGAIAHQKKPKKAKKKKRKSRASHEKWEETHQEYKKTKTTELVKEASQFEAAEGANFHALRRRSRGRQPPSFLQLSVQNVFNLYTTFTLDEVQHGLIIRDSKQRVLVYLFPISTIPSHLIEALVSALQEYDNSVSFPSYNYTPKRGDYQAHILGCWFKSGRFLQPYMTAHYRGPDTGIHYKRLDNPYYIAAKKFQKANRGFFQLVEDPIRQHYPDIWEIYRNIRVPAGCNKLQDFSLQLLSIRWFKLRYIKILVISKMVFAL